MTGNSEPEGVEDSLPRVRREYVEEYVSTLTKDRKHAMINALHDGHAPEAINVLPPELGELLMEKQELLDILTEDELPKAIAKAAMNGDAATVTEWLDSVPQEMVNTTARVELLDAQGWAVLDQTMLMLASGAHGKCPGQDEVVEVLLNRGANRNLQDQAGTTALMYAASRDNAVVTRLLLLAGAQTSLRDAHGVTAFQLASEECGSIILAHKQTVRAAEMDRRRELSREQRLREATEATAAETVAREQQQQRAQKQAAEAARRATVAAKLETCRQAIVAESAAKLAAERAKAEAEWAAQRERAEEAEAVTRAEQKAALLARKAAKAAAEREHEAQRSQTAAEEEARERARRELQSKAKKAAKQVKKEKKKKPSPFALQEEQERQAAEERRAEEERAAQVAAALAAAQAATRQ